MVQFNKTIKFYLFFSLLNKDGSQIRLKVKQMTDPYHVVANPSNLVAFGRLDFGIASESNLNNHSWSYLGWSYAHPTYSYGSFEADTFLAGAQRFATTEIEVYKVD